MMVEEIARDYLRLPWTWQIGFDSECSCWVVTVDEFPDFFAAGETPGEAAAAALEALTSHISGYLTTCTALPTPKRVSAHIGSTTNTLAIV